MRPIVVFLTILVILTSCKKEDIPTVKTGDVASVTRTGASVEGEIISMGDSEVTEQGICWSTSEKPLITDNIKVDDSESNSFTIDLTDLEPGTEYFVRAYATNTYGTGYGSIKSFTTDPALIPTVITFSRISVTQSTAKIYGEVLSDGDSPLVNYGFCWSITDNPTLSDNPVQPDQDFGYYISTFTNLSPGTRYYARAYATNNIGTAYGEIVSFSTCSEIPETGYTGIWQSVTDPYCGYLPQDIQGNKRFEISSDSVFTMYNLSGDLFISSSITIKSGNENFDTIYFDNPQPFPYYLIELEDCNNLNLLNPFELDIAGGCNNYTRTQ
ncbi:MAG: hypothetical protein RBU28_05335 [Bacteroidales bacterium]|jgi:hypothetical protein|nr:hypothetical protein [Bacteroidales bacterium]